MAKNKLRKPKQVKQTFTKKPTLGMAHSGIKMVDLEGLRECMIKVINQDKKDLGSGVVRYELLKDLSGNINCIDKQDWERHTQGFHNQGLTEHKRLPKQIGNFNGELVVMRHHDTSKCFEQYDGLLTGYMKAECELCYYEITL